MFEISASFALIFFIIKKIIEPDFTSCCKSLTHFFLLFFVIFSALSLLNSGPYLAKSYHVLFLKLMKYVFLFVFVNDTLSSRRRIEKALVVFSVSAGIIAIDALFQRMTGFDVLYRHAVINMEGGLRAVTGVFDHYNAFGAYLVVAISLIVGFLMSGTVKVVGAFSLAGLVLLLGVNLLSTFSRGAWIGIAAALLLMLVLSSKFKKTLACCIGISVLIFLCSSSLRERFQYIFQAGGDAQRFAIWKGALRMIQENPFLGKGLGTFMGHLPDYALYAGAAYAHNCYLQIWAETGIFSLVSFLIFIILILYKGIQIYKKGNNFILLGCICAMFGFLVHCFFDVQLYSVRLAALFWMLAGLTVALMRLDANARAGMAR